ncbi:sodium-coupled monocarboxylate transporter 1-like [Gigantopelta aegis]|uniref:sodium-coupled monocarboxylate transporter 1-like n=1 Tax=Gigantopelta aegis TaxID=1735272 RepID=UPI001B889E8B|nr:sodium-coupled monocarboxylate transporter 1-like [Gigantopelta aegis]
MEMSDRFGWPDYLVLALVLAVSVLIGIYHGFRGGGQQTTDEYLLAGRHMRLLPVGFSVLASFLSAISVLGVPVEIYAFGGAFWVNSFSYFISVPITAHVFIPLFHRLKLRSVYEYLEMRFCYRIRVLGCLVFTIQMVVYMAVVFYAPALAFSHVSGLSMWVSVLAVGVICTLYTTVGGLKAVIWTDVFQILVVIAGLLALIIKGTLQAGGVKSVWDKAADGGRLDIFNFDPDPLVRHTFWTLVFGGAVTTLSVYAVNQALVQRYLCVRDLKHAQGTIYFNLPTNIMTTTLLTALGLVAYANYKDCDPLRSGRITRLDQLVPLLVMDTLGMAPGLPGLFVACVFSAALSTVSSGTNALALVHLEDIIKPIFKMARGTSMTERYSTITSKVLALFFGVLTIGLAFLSSILGRTILQITLSSFGMTGGPLLGLFLLAIFFPFSNSWGAVAGLTSALGFSFWVAIGAIVNRPPLPILSLNTDGCLMNTTNATYDVVTSWTTTAFTTLASANMTSIPKGSGYTSLELYRLSYMWYSAVAVVICVIVGLVVSFLTGGQRGRVVNPDLVISVWGKISRWCPKNKRNNYTFTSDAETHILPELSSPHR